MEATVLLGTFNATEVFWYPYPNLCLDTILSRRSTDNSFDLTACFLLWHALSTVGPYIDRCGAFQIMSNQLNLHQMDSYQIVETLRMINGNRMHPELNLKRFLSNGLNTYVNKVFRFVLQRLLKTCLRVVIMGYCVQIVEVKHLFNPF